MAKYELPSWKSRATTPAAWAKRMVKFLKSNAAFERFLPYEASHWTEGGCDTLASALVGVLPDAELLAVEPVKAPAGHVWHYVVRHAPSDLYFDGDGARTLLELRRVWDRETGGARIVPVDAAYVARGRAEEFTACDPRQVRELREALAQALGPFPGASWAAVPGVR